MTLSPADQRALVAAVQLLEQPRLATRLASAASKPFDSAVNLVPGGSRAVYAAVQRAMLECLTIAVDSRGSEDFAPSTWRAKALTGITGGISGFFGGLLLPIEMSVTITVILRAIADIAGDQGEDLRQLEARLACLQVFALTGRKAEPSGAVGYYAARATLSRLSADLIQSVAQRGALDASAPVVARLLGEVVGRFGVILSERAAAGAIPVLGAIGGATLNVIFTDHFERMARGHFSIRRLERTYGSATIDQLYREAALNRAPAPRLTGPALA